MNTIYDELNRVERICRADIAKQLSTTLQGVIVSKPRSRASTSFVVRLRNDVTDSNTTSALKIIRETVSRYNVGFKFENRRLRMIKRGRKPIQGASYSYGGMLKLSEATEIDVYVAYEYV